MKTSILFLVMTFLSLTAANVSLAQSAQSGKTTPLRLGIVGLVHGHVAGLLASAQQRQDVEIVGIAEADSLLAGEYQKRFHLPEKLFFRNVESMLDVQRPEAVAVFSTTFDHRAIVEACSRRGVDVMMEKPLAVSYADAQAIQRAAHEGKIKVLVNYETTWYRNTRDLYQRVRQSGFGEIRRMVAHDGHRGPKEIGVGPEFLAWLTDPVLDGGGALMDFGCYGANLFTWLMDNQRPEAVTAVTQHLKPNVYPRVDDEATVILTYPHAQGIIQASWNWPFDRKDLEVYGVSGSALTIGKDVMRIRIGEKAEEDQNSPRIDPPEDDPLHYLRAVVRGQRPISGLSSLENNLIVSEILDAARRSAETGRTVQLPAVSEKKNH